MTTKALLLGTAAVLAVYSRPLQAHVDALVQHPGVSSGLVGSLVALIGLSAFAAEVVVAWTFAWNCFFKPLGKNATQEGRLNRFYEGQATVRLPI